MNRSCQSRFSPLKLRQAKFLKNRVVVPAMASQTAAEEGLVTAATRAHYRRLGESGAGLIFLEYSYVHSSGKSEDNQLGVSEDSHMDGLAELARIIQKSGARVGIQLTHSGGKSSQALTGGRLMAPSRVAIPVKDKVLETPVAMTPEDIDLWVESFVQAAQRAARAGFDFVELHSAHGYGLNQWLSPLTNQRTDAFGGSLENRLRLLTLIVTQIKKACPDLLLSVRIPGQDHLEGGLSLSDGIKVAKHLESLGIDLINVSSGIGGWRRPRERQGEGYLVPEAIEIQSHVAAPVIGVGGIQTGEYIDRLVKSGSLSLAAVGRALLEDPRSWFKLNLDPASGEDVPDCLGVAV